MRRQLSLRVVVVEAEFPAEQQLDLLDFIAQLTRTEHTESTKPALEAVTGRRVKKKARES